MPIIFFYEETDFKIKAPLKLKKWLHSAALEEGIEIKSLNYIFCTDAYLLDINKQYLNHDDFTDIITFDNSEAKNFIEGDIYISVERIMNNAEIFNVGIVDELHRVMVHGLLHLLGYSDKKTDHKLIMTQKEDFYLNKRNFNVPRGTQLN